MAAPAELRGGPPGSVADYAFDAIREAILSGRYPLGSRLDQNAVAAELGISTIPVREALRRLEAAGIVHINPRRGASVASISTGEMVEIYRIREVLDALAISEAVPRLTDVQLDEIERILVQLEAATARHDYEKTVALNRDFHGLIYAASAMPRLVEMINNLVDRYRIYNNVYIPRHSEHSTHEHREIYEACRRRDVEKAVALTRAHIRRACEQLTEELEERR